MSTRYVKTVVVVVLLTSIIGCGKSESTDTPFPPTATPLPPTPTPLPPTATPRPTETLTATVAPATAPRSSEIKGKFDIGGYELFIHCVGTGAPTVIMEAGWDDVGETWSLVQPEVAQVTRACVYDRAGLGQSEPGPAPSNMPRVVVAELKALLEAAGVEGPYVLVGHSWGGLYVRLYADLYREDVVGMVLVESSHPDMFRRNLAVLPPESPNDGESLKFYREWFTGSADDPTLKLDPKLLEAGSLGDLPLVVLTSPRKQRADDFPVELSEKFDEIWVELHKELALLSSNSTHVIVEGSGHFIQHEQPDQVIEAILHVIEQAASVPTTLAPAGEATSDHSPSADILASLQGLPIDEFFEASDNQLLLRDPEALTSAGLSEYFGLRNDQLTDLSDAYIRETQALERAILDLLRTYDREALTPEQQVSYDVYEWVLDNQVRGHQFMYHDYPLHHFLRSYDFSLDSLFTSTHPLEDRQDVEDYIARLSQVSRQVGQLLEGLALREERGIVPPKFIVELTRGNLLDYLQVPSPEPSAVNPRALGVYTRLEQALGAMDDLSAAERQALLDAAQAQIEASFIPAYLEMIDYQDHLLTIASDDAGAWKLPDGDAYYAYMLRQETSTDLSPQEVHEIGLAEVARIQAEMRALFGQLGYPRDESLGTLINRAIEDAGSYDAFTQAGKEQVVAAYEALLEEVDRHLDAVFDVRPHTQAIIVGDLSFGGGGGYYQPGAMDGSRPGAFHAGIGDSWVAKYRMPTTLYHEAVPGHHFQIAIAQELDLPGFRNGVIFNGYAEGWALYAEHLAWELGLYDDDPYGNLGRLHMELLRAVRLVADTGLHAMGWTREQTWAYMDEAMGTSGEFAHEVDRYVVLPAQATGYKIGMIKLLELRQTAMDQLGEQFDIREFHNVVLSNGSLPLEILERIVQEYIASKSGG